MSKYVYATYFTPEDDGKYSEVESYDGYIAIALATDFSSDMLEDDICNALPMFSTDPLCVEDETNYSIPKGRKDEALAILAACPLVSHSPDFQAYCKAHSGVYGWKAD